MTEVNAPTGLIADDEAWLRHSLKQKLRSLWPELQIVAECEDGESAWQAAEAHKPELLFLDINMPFLNGIQIAERVSARLAKTPGATESHDHWQPLLVFVTAYDEFAVTAFEHNAVDYLLKPLDEMRLQATLQRLKQRLAERHQSADLNSYQHKLKQLQSALADQQRPDYLRHITVSVGQRRVLLDLAEVLCIQADAKYSKLVTAKKEYLIRQSLTELEQQLDPEMFWRIHRSTLLNARCIDYCTPTVTGRLEVSLKQHPLKLTVSRKYLGRFKGM